MAEYSDVVNRLEIPINAYQELKLKRRILIHPSGRLTIPINAYQELKLRDSITKSNRKTLQFLLMPIRN